MNKTKRVAWRKHRIKAKKDELKRKAANQKVGGTTAPSTARR
jgi:hypothetical protein